jgi:hypothetical protein
MLTFWGIVTVATMVGGLPAVSGLWLFERSRARRRNRRGECATCGTPWQATPSGAPYLIHGRLVCESCAQTARRRLPWHFGLLRVATAAATAGAVAAEGVAMLVVTPLLTTGAMTIGTVQLMKAANRRDQCRIARGEFTDLEAVCDGAALPRVLSSGPAA